MVRKFESERAREGIRTPKLLIRSQRKSSTQLSSERILSDIFAKSRYGFEISITQLGRDFLATKSRKDSLALPALIAHSD